MKPATPQTQPSPSTQLRQAVFGGSLMNEELTPKTANRLALVVAQFEYRSAEHRSAGRPSRSDAPRSIRLN